ncbi:DUF1223 domain-containing protein [uncultured Methylobacterium sp.]|uniref:DUF1223 domain-containing protein n=1 Tax=uncultured Methylobacterium sp. TaxID=157278 RepID=UPI0035CA5FA1
MTPTRTRAHAPVRIGAILTLVACALPCPAAAESLRAVVELFTSQGCAACRSADPVIGDLARHPGVLALTLPVTYWDYLGWKDTLAQAPFGERQHAYAGGLSARQVFTPQAVVNGGASTVGSDRAGLERLVRESGSRGGLPVPVRGEEHGDRIVVEVGAEPGSGAKGDLDSDLKGDVWLVPVLRSRPVVIGGGENRGRTVTYVNVVRGLQRLGPWTGQPVRFEVSGVAARVAEADAWVVVVQGAAGGRPGRIWGAAKGPGL